jgi:hypothetical protein
MKFYYTLVLCIRVTEGLNPKDCFKRYSTISGSGSLIVKHTLFALEENVIHWSVYIYESQYVTQPSSDWTSH